MKSKVGVPLEGFAEYSRYAASQGAVLLKNENKFLPLKETDKIAIFGRCQVDYYRSGTGSGGAVNVEYTTRFLDSLREQQPQIINEGLAKIYEAWISENPFDNGGGGWAAEPWNQKEMPLSDELVHSVRQNSNKAIVIIGRTAGEDKDNLDTQGSYKLTDEEKDMLLKVTTHFDEVGVVLNVSNIIDMNWAIKYEDKIKSIIYVWHGGMEGGNAAIDVITGKETPSGKLPDTIAYSIEDYSSTKNHGNEKANIYQEDIYVGYRYFETFAPEKVQYPFGFGLSYTEFSIENTSAKLAGEVSNNREDGIAIKTTVKNIGQTYSGKEVVQVYVNAPQGKLGKPSRELVGFAKTNNLQPGESQELEIFVPFRNLASYDDSGVTGNKSSYVLEEGKYTLYIGNSIKATDILNIEDKKNFKVESLVVIEQLTEALAPIYDFDRIKPGDINENGVYELTYEQTPKRSISLKQRIEDNKPRDLEITGDKGIKLDDVRKGKATIEEFISQLNQEDLATIVRGEGMSHPQVTPGTASAFGGVSDKLRNLGIPLMCTADGPSGVRMESGLKSTQLPIGTLLASSWDIELVKKLYTMEGEELVGNCIDLLLGPGMNIHRNPLNGRNFEYYSEDPLLTGKMASAVVCGIEKGGACATLKHFACNSQEAYRHDIDAVISERAAREIYLKGFEIAVKEGNAKSIMTAYNPINGHWTASNYDLNTTILRDEWGFDGIVMTDWWARMNDVVDGGEGTRNNTMAMVKSQNDVYMVVGNFGAEVNEYNDNTIEGLQCGKLSLGELQRSAMNICKFATTTKAMDRDYYLFAKPQVFEPIEEMAITTTINDINNILEITSQESESFRFEGEGVYQVDVTYSSVAKGLAQTTCNIFLNDNLMTTIQAGTTNGEKITKKLGDVELKCGNYRVSFDHKSQDLKIYKVILKKINY